MLKSNLHTHTHYSDGSHPPEEYILEALRLGFCCIGFSDHSPLPFENSFALREDETGAYFEVVRELKIKYRGRIDVMLGMEIDYIPGVGHSPDWFRQHYRPDYIIGSVHLVKNPNMEELWFIDGPHQEIYDEGLNKVFGGDIRAGVTAYFRQLQELISRYRPEIVGHLDKIKMHNKVRWFREDEPWYRTLAEETLTVIRDAGVRIEANTRGLYKKRSKTLFPGPEILRVACGLGIPAVMTTDAHKPHELALELDAAAEGLKQAGYKSQDVLTKDGWMTDPL